MERRLRDLTTLADEADRFVLQQDALAEQSHRRKSEPYQSAMSMLNFYINRAGDNLPARRKKVLEDAKDELRKVFGRDD